MKSNRLQDEYKRQIIYLQYENRKHKSTNA